MSVQCVVAYNQSPTASLNSPFFHTTLLFSHTNCPTCDTSSPGHHTACRQTIMGKAIYSPVSPAANVLPFIPYFRFHVLLTFLLGSILSFFSRWFRVFQLSFFKLLRSLAITFSCQNVFLLDDFRCYTFRCGPASFLGSGPCRNAESDSLSLKVFDSERGEYGFLNDVPSQC
jgi:hypothetical protein